MFNVEDSWIHLIVLWRHSNPHAAVTLYLHICVKNGFIHYIIYWNDTFFQAKGAEILQKSRSHLKLVHTRRVTQSKFNTEDSQILGITIHNLWAGQQSQYSDWLQAGRSGNQIPVGAGFSAPVQTGPGAHPASCTMGTGSFPGVKSGQGMTLTPHPLLVLWSRKGKAIPLLPLWAIWPVQSLSACTSVHFFILSYTIQSSWQPGARVLRTSTQCNSELLYQILDVASYCVDKFFLRCCNL